MTTTSDSSEAPLPSTLGGPGWRPRRRASREELGELWAECGCSSEYGRLRRVLLAWPGDELARASPPDEHLLLESVSLPLMQRQARFIGQAYTDLGVECRYYAPARPPPPNLVFLRDLFFMTPEGAIVGRMASEQRAGEERFATEALAQAGIPVLATVHGRATFEGADGLWLSPRCVLLACGLRTNAAGCAYVAGVLAELGVDAVFTELPAATQHLLGVVNCLAADLAAVDASRLTPRLRGILSEHGYRLLEFPANEELSRRRGMNFVAVEPYRVLMPAGCPGIRGRLEEAGVCTREVEISEYLKSAGGLACLTGIVKREPPACRGG